MLEHEPNQIALEDEQAEKALGADPFPDDEEKKEGDLGQDDDAGKGEFKPSDTLAARVGQAEKALGTEFFPDKEKKEEVLALDRDSIKEKYPYKYKEYKKVLREIFKRKYEASHEGESLSEWPDTPLTETQIEELQSEFISPRNYIAATNNLESYIKSYKTEETESKLRKHQRDVFDDLLVKFFNMGYREGYIGMPTGTGKTAVFTTLVKALAGKKDGDSSSDSLKTLILVPSIDLVHQTIGKDENGEAVLGENGEPKRGFAAFAPELDVTTYFSKKKDLSGEVVVSTYQSFVNLMKNGTISNDTFDLIICDEAHQALGEETAEQIRNISPQTIKIAVTATLEYTDKKSVTELFPNKIHELTIKEAIEKDILARADGNYLKTGTMIDGVTLSKGDYSPEVFKKLNNEGRNQLAMENLEMVVKKKMRENGSIPQGIVSCLPGDNLAHAKEMAERIRQIRIIDPKTGEERGLKAEWVGGETDDRQEMYKRFDNGEIDFLTFVDVLKQGWDSENAKVWINLRPTTSRVLETQIFGRVLRKTADDKRAYVAEFDDGFTGKARPYTVWDVMEQKRIIQGGEIGGMDDGEETGEKGKREKIPPSPELLALLAKVGTKPEIIRELKTDFEEVGDGVIKDGDEMYMTGEQIIRFFSLQPDRNIVRLAETNSIEVKEEGGERHYAVGAIGKALERIYQNGSAPEFISLKNASPLLGMGESYLKGIVDEYHLPLQSKSSNFHFEYKKKYKFKDLLDKVQRHFEGKEAILDVIRKDPELGKKQIMALLFKGENSAKAVPNNGEKKSGGKVLLKKRAPREFQL